MKNDESLPAAAGSHQPCSRDIDAALHHHLFPWDQAYCRTCANPIGVTVRGLYGLRSICTIESCGAPQGWKRADELPPPRYSTDPAASKRLRDKMRADGWKSCLFSTDVFTMRYWGYKRGQDTVEAHADTEEMAVALAALKALGLDPQALPDGGAPQADPKA